MKQSAFLIGLGLSLLSFFAPNANAALKKWDGGGADNNWTTPLNWVGDTLPLSSDQVVFGTESHKPCLINLSTKTYSLTISSPTMQVTLANNNTLTISQNMSITSGTFNGGLGTLIKVGTHWMKGTNSFFNAGTSTVTFSTTTAGRNITGSTTFYSLRMLSTGSTFYFQAGKTQKVVRMINFENVTLRSSTDGSTWYLKLTGSSQTIKNVAVKNSNANSGSTLSATQNSRDLGGNYNWNFVSQYYTWDGGGTNNNWSNPLNWNPNGVPGSNASLTFDYFMSNKSAVADMDITLDRISFQNGFNGIITVSSDVIVNSSVTVPMGTTILMNGGSLSADRKTGTTALYIQGTVCWVMNPLADSTITARGWVRIVNSGSLLIGSTAAAIPSNRTALLVLDSSSTPNSARVLVENGGRFTARGSSINALADLESLLSAGNNSFDVTKATAIASWKVGDRIIVGKTSVGIADETEMKTITSKSAKTITVNSNFAYSHQPGALVDNLSRNVKIRASSSTYKSHIRNESMTTSNFILDSVEMAYLGDSGIPGVNFPNTGGVRGTITKCSMREGGYDGIALFSVYNTTISYNQIYKMARYGLYVYQSMTNSIIGNDVVSNNNHGIFLDYRSDMNILKGNLSCANNGEGFFVNASSKNVLSSNKSLSNRTRGILLQNANFSILKSNLSAFNYGDGFNLINADKSLLELNETSNNSGAGITLSQSDLCTLHQNKVHDNSSMGLELGASHLNRVNQNNIYNNNLYGLELYNSHDNTMTANAIYGGHTYGLVTSSGSFNNVYTDGKIGWSPSNVEQAETVAEIEFSNSPGALVLKNTKVSQTALDVRTASLSAPGRSLISYKHNGENGVTRIYGDAQADGFNMNADYWSYSYYSTPTAPTLLKGLGHSASIYGLNPSYTQTQLISLNYRAGMWHVDGSVSGVDMITAFTGSKSNTPVPTTNSQFYLNFNPGGAPEEGDRIDFLLLSAAQDQSIQKKILFGRSAAGFNNGRSRLTIPYGKNFNVMGHQTWPSIIDWISGSATYYSIVSSGSFYANRAAFTHMDTKGLQFTGMGTVSLSTVTFDYALGGTSNTYITATDLTSNATFYGIVFNDSSLTYPKNVRTQGSTTNLNWYFKKWSGSRGGPSFEYDPGYRVNWESIGPTQTPLYPWAFNVFQTSASVAWNSAMVSGYTAQLSTNSLFNTLVSSKNITALTTTYTSLNPDTTYWFRVKVATEISFHDLSKTWFHTTPAPLPYTLLYPYVTNTTSHSITTQWTHQTGHNYVVWFSTRNDFSQLISSRTIINSNTTTYFNLLPNKQYYFGVKISTEPNSSFEDNWVSTYTKPMVGATLLHPYFLGVGNDYMTVRWENIPTSTFTTLCSTDPSFTTFFYPLAWNINERTYTPIPSDTWFYFKVKIATEPDSSYSAVISTKTRSLAGGGEFALKFYTDDVVFVPSGSDFDMLNARTVEFWFKRIGFDNNIQYILSKENNAFTQGWVINLQTDGKLRYAPIGVGGGLTSNFSITNSSWHHFALIKNNDNWTEMYLDGTFAGSGWTNTPDTTPEALKFGNSGTLGHDFKGLLDEVRFWNFARPLADINATKGAPIPSNSSGLVGYWNFNEGAGQFAHDLTVNARDGQLGTSPAAEATDPEWVIDPIPGFGMGGDTLPPQVQIITPADGSTKTVSSLTALYGTAQDNQTINFVSYTLRRLKDNMYWKFEPTGTAGYWVDYYFPNNADGLTNWSVNGSKIYWSTGSYRLQVKAEDSNYNAGLATSTFHVDVSTETNPPTVQILYPVDGSTYTPTQLTILSGTAHDDTALKTVGLQIRRHSDNRYWSKITWTWVSTAVINTANGLENWDLFIPTVAWSTGRYSLVAGAEDQGGNLTQSTITFIVNTSTGGGNDYISPTVEIIHPVNGSTHAPSALTNLYGTAADNQYLMDLAVQVKNLTTGYFWDGVNFSTTTAVWFYIAVVPNWSFSQIPESKWVNGHNYRLWVRARDGSMNQTIKASNFHVATSSGDTLPPTVTIVHPTEGGTYSSATIMMDGTAGDNMGLSSVEACLKNRDTGKYYDGVSFNSFSAQYFPVNGLINWTYYIPQSAWQNGNFSLSVRAIDTSNNSFSASRNFSITGVGGSSDTTAPSVKILKPLSITYTDPAELTLLSGTASDDVSVMEVKVSIKDDNNKYWDGSSWASNTEFWLYTSSIPTAWKKYMPVGAWKNGIFFMRARALDTSNNVKYSSVTFTVSGSGNDGNADTQAPLIFIYNPAHGAVGQPPIFTNLNGRCEDAFGVREIKIALKSMTSNMYWNGSGFTNAAAFYINPVIDQFGPTYADWHLNMPVNAYTNGNYLMTVKADDPSSNLRVVNTSFTVIDAGDGAGDSTAPTLHINFPENGQTYTASQLLSISGTSNDANGVRRVELKIKRGSDGMYWDGAVWSAAGIWMLCTGTATWSWNAPIALWADGAYTIYAKATDKADLMVTQSVDITVSGTGAAGNPPTVSIGYPLDGQTYQPANMAIISGSASDDGIVSKVRIRIQDINMNLNWNPTTALWVSYDHWFDATYAAGLWSCNQVPAWPSGHFKVMVQAEDNQGLLSLVVARNFYIEVNGGASDFTPPSAVNDLRAQKGSAEGSILLDWTATGDDGMTGTASQYRIKYRSGPMETEDQWMQGFDIAMPPITQNPPVPTAPGTTQSLTVLNLTPGTPYYFAMRVLDEAGNRSWISNNAFATAGEKAGVQTSDGEGTASISPATFPERTLTDATLTFTVGASGINPGGKVNVKIPESWPYPQTWGSSYEGYVSAYTNNPLTTLNTTINGPMVEASVVTGVLNTGDKIFLSYKASPYCGASATSKFDVLSQASSFGQPKLIASPPTVSITAGGAAWLGFDGWEKLVKLEPTQVKIQGQSYCGQKAAVQSNTNFDVEVVRWNTNTYQYEIDTDARLSLASNMSTPFTSQTVMLPSGQDTLTLYYLLNSIANKGNNYIRIRYLDLQTQTWTSENYQRIIPYVGAQVITNLSVDTGVKTPGQTNVTFTPDGNGQNDMVFFNFSLGVQDVGWNIQLSNDGFATKSWEYNGWGPEARVPWDGRRFYPFNDTAPPGTYQARITVAGIQNNTLSVTLQANGITGHVENAASPGTPVAGVMVDAFGPMMRHAETDASGNYGLIGLPNGTYRVTFFKQGFANHELPSVVVNNGNAVIPTVNLKPMAKLVFNGTRPTTYPDVWGSMRTKVGTYELASTIHFANGNTIADNGAPLQKPEFYLPPDVSLELKAEIPGYSVPPLNQTFTPGQIYNWNVTLTEKKKITGQIRLANGVLNTAGTNINISAGLDSNSDLKFDAGYPTFFTYAYLAPYEMQTNYTLPGLDNGIYLIKVMADRLAPQETLVTINNADQYRDFTLDQAGSYTINITFTGDTTGLNGVNPTFPVTLRLASSLGYNFIQTVDVTKNATVTSGVATFVGIPNGTYNLLVESVNGFGNTQTGVITVNVLNGGSTALNFARYSGGIQGTVKLAGGSNMANVRFTLTKDGIIQPLPTLAGNAFTFSYLNSGQYQLSLIDISNNIAVVRPVLITNGLITNLGEINLSGGNFYSVSGTIKTVAAAPYNTLNSIVENSTELTIYTQQGTTQIPALRVAALLVNPDGTVDPLPTTAARVWDPAKIKFAAVDVNTGVYQFFGLLEGQNYLIRPNVDINHDGQADFPALKTYVTLFANRTGLDFTYRDGATIQGTLTALEEDNGHALKIVLENKDFMETAGTRDVALVGTEASFSFTNLRTGRYQIRVEDIDAEAMYAAKTENISLGTANEVKTVAITLTRGSVVRCKLATLAGPITSANASLYLPEGYSIKLDNKQGLLVDATGPGSDGTFTFNTLPGTYDISIRPPWVVGAAKGKSFLPIRSQITVESEQYVDAGTFFLEPGTDVQVTVTNANNQPLANIPVMVQPSMTTSNTPLVGLTDQLGHIMFEDLDHRDRFFNVKVNPAGYALSQNDYDQNIKTMVDITKLTELSATLLPLSGSLKGQVDGSGTLLVAAYGQNIGLNGVSVVVNNRETNNIAEYLTQADGNFDIRLAAGYYDIEFLAQGFQPVKLSNVAIANASKDLGTLSLIPGTILSGSIRNADGTIPTNSQIAKLLAIDTTKRIYKAHLYQYNESVDSYAFFGLAPGAYTISAADKDNRMRALVQSFTVPENDTTLDLTFVVPEARLETDFIEKVPDGVDVLYSCNKKFRNNPDDLDGNGIADDDEFEEFVTVLQGNGNLSFTAVSADRKNASYQYVRGVETGQILQLSANFTLEDKNPKTGENFTASNISSFHFGLSAIRKKQISEMGDSLGMPDGAGLNFPDNWSQDGSAEVTFKAADSNDALNSEMPLSAGKGALALAQTLGPAAYPSNMYRAIKTLADAPEVNPFSSFYDIFLPAGVSRFFTNEPTLTLKYDEGADPDQINVYYFNEGLGIYTLENTKRRVNTTNRTISVAIHHASVFTVLESSAPVIRGDNYAGDLEVFNFPNPFDLNTKSVTLQHPGSASATQEIKGTMMKISVPPALSGALEIKIYNVAGEKVRTISDTVGTGGGHFYLEWDGTNEKGEEVASGIYFGRLTINGGNEKFFKMAVVK